jgi:Heme/copper-type cytochrome/quinol oxidases, subunit 1
MLVLIYLIYKSIKKGKIAGDDPWDAYTLEWACSSPPALKNFDELPLVYGRRPLYDWKHPDNPDE